MKKKQPRKRKARRGEVAYQRISAPEIEVMPTKIKTAIFLDPEQVADLKTIQREVGVPMSVSIRKALDAYLTERKKNEPQLKN